MTRTLLLILLLALPATAHTPEDEAVLEPGTYLNHVMIHEGALAPGEWHNSTMAYGGTPLRGWWFLLFSGRVDAPIDAAVLHDNDTVHAWTWQPGEEDLVVFRLEETGFHELRLHNPGPDNATYRMFYDNTCDCTSKAALLQESPLWFNYNVSAPGHVGLDFAVVPFTGPPPVQDPPPLGDVRVEVIVAKWAGGAWTEGFDVLHQQEELLVLDGPYAAFEVDFEADEEATYYVLATLRHDSNETWRFQVRPVAQLPEEQEASLPVLLALLALLAVAARQRRTRS